MTAETQVSRELRIDSYDAIMEANSNLMDEIYNDGKLTPMERLKGLTVGVRNQVMLSRDLAARRKELYSVGMKANGKIKSLGFNPMDDQTSSQ